VSTLAEQIQLYFKKRAKGEIDNWDQFDDILLQLTMLEMIPEGD